MRQSDRILKIQAGISNYGTLANITSAADLCKGGISPRKKAYRPG